MKRIGPWTKVQTKFQPKVMRWSKVAASRIGIWGVGTLISCHHSASTLPSPFLHHFFANPRVFGLPLIPRCWNSVANDIRWIWAEVPSRHSGKIHCLFGSAILATAAVHDTAMLLVWNLTQDFSLFNPPFWEIFRDFIHSSLLALPAIISNHAISVRLIVGFFGRAAGIFEWIWAFRYVQILPINQAGSQFGPPRPFFTCRTLVHFTGPIFAIPLRFESDILTNYMPHIYTPTMSNSQYSLILTFRVQLTAVWELNTLFDGVAN
jgi:hypothetical protein